MKKLFLLAFSAIAFAGISSCKDDDDDNSNAMAMLHGTWKFSKAAINDGDSGNLIITENADSCTEQTNITFNADNSITEVVFEDDGAGCMSATDNGNYTYDASTKILTYNGKSANVITLTDNELVFEVDLGFDFNGDGINENGYEYYYQ